MLQVWLDQREIRAKWEFLDFPESTEFQDILAKQGQEAYLGWMAVMVPLGVPASQEQMEFMEGKDPRVVLAQRVKKENRLWPGECLKECGEKMVFLVWMVHLVLKGSQVNLDLPDNLGCLAFRVHRVHLASQVQKATWALVSRERKEKKEMLGFQVRPALRLPLGSWNSWDFPKASKEQRAFWVPKDFLAP